MDAANPRSFVFADQTGRPTNRPLLASVQTGPGWRRWANHIMINKGAERRVTHGQLCPRQEPDTKSGLELMSPAKRPSREGGKTNPIIILVYLVYLPCRKCRLEPKFS